MRTLIILFVVLPCLSVSAWANPLLRMEIPSSPNPVGSGARALGMGGAFIAVADDATAASWNPGGLNQLDFPEMSVVYSYVGRSEDNTFGGHPEASGDSSVDAHNLNYLSVAWPFQVGGRNMHISLNYQHLYDFNREWRFDWNDPESHSSEPMGYEYEQTGDLYALGLACCVQVSMNLSLGITLNYWGDFLFENKWGQKYDQKSDIASPSGIRGVSEVGRKDEYAFEGWNANIGFLWRISQKWTMGGVLKTSFTGDVERSFPCVCLAGCLRTG